MIHNSRLALSAVGEQQDVDTLTEGYQEEWWLEQLARRNASAIWLRSKYPHNYEITAVSRRDTAGVWVRWFEVTNAGR